MGAGAWRGARRSSSRARAGRGAVEALKDGDLSLSVHWPRGVVGGTDGDLRLSYGVSQPWRASFSEGVYARVAVLTPKNRKRNLKNRKRKFEKILFREKQSIYFR